MALAIYYNIDGMTPEKYAAINAALDAAGHGNPPGRSVHVGFHTRVGIHVFDVWESQESFDAFGEHLMPILDEHQIDPGSPVIAEVERLLITG